MHFKHVLVTTDLSDAATRAFPFAARLARGPGAKVTLLHIVETTRAIPHGAPFAPPMPQPGVQGIVDDCKAGLAAQAATLAALLDGDDASVDSAVVVAADVAPAVDAEATDRGCDVVVISTHGRSGLRRLVLGSVAEAVLRHAQVPVLCIPPTPE